MPLPALQAKSGRQTAQWMPPRDRHHSGGGRCWAPSRKRRACRGGLRRRWACGRAVQQGVAAAAAALTAAIVWATLERTKQATLERTRRWRRCTLRCHGPPRSTHWTCRRVCCNWSSPAHLCGAGRQLSHVCRVGCTAVARAMHAAVIVGMASGLVTIHAADRISLLSTGVCRAAWFKRSGRRHAAQVRQTSAIRCWEFRVLNALRFDRPALCSPKTGS